MTSYGQRQPKLSPEDLAILKEFNHRKAARENLLDFITYTKRDYQIAPFHASMCRILDEFVEGKIKRLMLFAPPQHGKSEMVSRRLPAYLLGRNPKCKIVGASYGADLATSFNRNVQQIIDDELYKNLFPDTYLNSSNVRTDAKGSYLRNADIFETVNYRGYYKSVGVGGALTGTPADVAIIDDPVKDAIEAESEVYRERVWQWYLTVLSTRLHDKSQVLLTMTRWHYDDLAGRILESEKGEWTVLKFPALKTGDTSNPYDTRKEGEALYPEKHSADTLLKKKKQIPRIYTSLYAQEPSDEQGTIWQKWFIPVPDSLFPSRSQLENYGTDWDTAFSEQDQLQNASTAFVTSGRMDNKMYIDEIGHFMAGFPTMIERMNMRPAPHYIEAKASGKSAKQTLVKLGVPAIEVDVQGGDKIARANLASVYPQAGMVYCRESILERLYYDDEQGILKFPNGKKKDLADTLAQAIQRQLGGNNFWFM